MNPTSTSVRQYSLIFDDIYTEKHTQFSTLVMKWFEDKQHYLSQNYKKSIDHIFQEIELDHKKFEKRIHELLKVANAEYQIFSKIKPIAEDKEHYQKSQAVTVISEHSLTNEEIQMFHCALQNSHKKSSDIFQLAEFASRFFAITSTELNEFKSFASQVQNRKHRYLFDIKRQVTEESRICNQLCLKNKAKYFHVKNYQKLRESLQKQVKILRKTDEDSRECYKHSLARRKQILQNCIDNMKKFQQLYSKVFCQNLFVEIREYFVKLVEELTKKFSQFQSTLEQLPEKQESSTKNLETLYQRNIQMFTFVMQEITMGEWRHIILETFKKSSFTSFASMGFTSHQPSQQNISQGTSKQLDIPSSSNQPFKQVSQQQMIMTLTIDYKLLFRKQSDKNKIWREYLLNQLKLKLEKDKKKVMDERKLWLREKTTKGTLQIKFSDADKRQEFLLHLERFQLLKDNLNK